MKKKDENLQWLKAHGFRKERGEPSWRLYIHDADKPHAAPHFTVRAVRGPSGSWHAKVSVDRGLACEINFVMLEKVRGEEDVPEDWDEPWDIALGHCICAKTAQEAVGMATRRASTLACGLVSRQWYDVVDLDREMHGKGQDRRGTSG